MRGASRSTVPDSSSTEAQEKKAVPSQELREQILDSFIQVLSATGRDDQYIKNIIREISKVYRAQENFIEENFAEKRIIRKELGEGVDESFKDELKTLVQKSEKLTMQNELISRGMQLSKVSVGQKEIKIDELKEDLDSKLNKLNLREREERADELSKNFLTDYTEGRRRLSILLKKLPLVINFVHNTITTDNEKKMKERIQALGELGEEIIEKEITKFNTDYKEGEKNYPDLLDKLPKIIKYCYNRFNINEITSDNEKKMRERIQLLGELGEKMIEKEVAKFEDFYKKGKENYPTLLKGLPKAIKHYNLGNIIFDEELVGKIKKHTRSLKDLIKKMKDELGIIRPEKSLQETNVTLRAEPLTRTMQELGAESSLAHDEGHRMLMENYNNNFKARFNDNNEHQINGQNTSRSLLPEFGTERSDKKIDEGERDREFQKDVKNHENNRLALQRIYNNLNDKKFTECDLEKLDKTIKQIHIYNDIFIEQTLNKYGIDPQAVRSPEAKTISPQQIVKYPPAPTLPPKPGNSYKSPPKASQTAIPSVYSPKVNSVYSPKVNSPNSPQALAISAYPIALAAHFNPNSLPEYRQQTMFSVTYHVNTSPQQYSHVSRGPDVYSQVPRGSVHFTQTPTAISTKTSTFTPIQLSPPNNSRFN